MTSNPTTLLRNLFNAAIASADPARCLARHLPPPPDGRLYIVAAGKAAASMARAVEAAWPETALSGIALCPYGHALPCRQIDVVEAAHPVPDERGETAARRILAEAESLGAGDMLLFLVSGGGSSLLAVPAGSLSLGDKATINRALLHSGAPISEMNIVRKRLSAIKGGRLAVAAYPAKVVTRAISDVPGDDLATIASGPTIADTPAKTAETILSQYGIPVPAHIRAHLRTAQSSLPPPDHPAFARSEAKIIARPADMIASTTRAAESLGLTVLSLGAQIEGEAAEVARAHANLALQQNPTDKPVLILSGGETTVTVRHGEAAGRGGRNTEYLLALALALNGAPNIHALAADTDGVDGAETIAGATITPDTLQRAQQNGLDPQAMLQGHDSASLFRTLGDTVVTGPTRTNVNDFRAIWVGPRKRD